MADTPDTSGETATSGSVSNDVSAATAPVVDNGSSAEVERLRKELEQQKMRNNQLSNQIEERDNADKAAKQKQMEDKDEFKQLYSDLKTQIDERDAKDAERERQATLKSATGEILKDYPENVRKLAETAGLSLTDDSEEATSVLKAKLDEFKAQVGTTASVGSNNGYNSAPVEVDRESLVKREAPGEPSPMAEAGARGNNTVAYKYIGALPAIQRMREIANS